MALVTIAKGASEAAAEVVLPANLAAQGDVHLHGQRRRPGVPATYGRPADPKRSEGQQRPPGVPVQRDHDHGGEVGHHEARSLRVRRGGAPGEMPLQLYLRRDSRGSSKVGGESSDRAGRVTTDISIRRLPFRLGQDVVPSSKHHELPISCCGNAASRAVRNDSPTHADESRDLLTAALERFDHLASRWEPAPLIRRSSTSTGTASASR